MSKTLKEIKESVEQVYYVDDDSLTSDDCIVCPWCGYVDEVPFDCGDPPEDMECMDCEKPFTLCFDWTVTFTSSRKGGRQ